MRKLSMFQTILLVVFGGLAVVGVLIFAFAIGGGTSNSVGAVKVWGTLNQTAFTTVIRQAADSEPQLGQVSYEQKDPATYEEELTNALASGSGPDLFILRQDYVIKDAGKIVPVPFSLLPAAQFDATFIEASSPFVGADGVLGVPILADPLVLFWNKELLASAGYAKPPAYWDEFFAIARKVSKRDDAGVLLKSGVAFGEYQNVDDAKDILATLILQAGGRITTRDSGGALVAAILPKAGESSQAAVSALRFYTEFADPSKEDYSWSRSLPQASQAFAAGDVGLYVGYASEEQTIARANPNLNFAAAPLPQIRSSPTALTTARVYSLAVSRTSKRPSSAITAAFLLASNTNSAALSTALGLPSARRDVVNAVVNDPAGQAGANDALYARMAIVAHSWVDPDSAKTADVFRAMIENTTSGAALVTEAVQRADQQLSQILGI